VPGVPREAGPARPRVRGEEAARGPGRVTSLGYSRNGLMHCIDRTLKYEPGGLMYAATYCDPLGIMLVLADVREQGKRELITCPTCAAEHVRLCFVSWLS
jgi:hypothetical protein